MAKYPADFTCEYPETLDRGKTALQGLFGWLYAGIPHGVVLYFYGIAVSVIVFVCWWIVIFTGKFPRGLHDFIVGYFRWSVRVNAFLFLMRNEYPPFTSEQ
jgi:hypothetical protein